MRDYSSGVLIEPGKDWVSVRRELTDEQISAVYHLYQGLWPRETDLLKLLPKPDGNARAIYTGSIHPNAITNFALGSSLYFGELIIQHSFLNAATVKREFSPVENPRAYRQEFLKATLFFFTVLPLVGAGLVNLIPDPCDFDVHLRDQMMRMARARSVGIDMGRREEPRMSQEMEEDIKRGFMSLPPNVLRSQLLKALPGLDDAKLDETLRYIEQLKERDPLAVLQEDSLVGEKGGKYHASKLAPNFEMAMYLAQATGSCIVTDSPFRWTEIRKAAGKPYPGLVALARGFDSSEFLFPQNAEGLATLAFDKTFAAYPALMRDIFKYLAKLSERGPKPNREAQLISRFAKTHAPAQAAIKEAGVLVKDARISCVFPSGGIQDNTVNRLLLMSSSERHLQSVPMAFFIEERVAG